MAKTKKPKAFWRQLGFQLNQNDVADNRRIEQIEWLKKGRNYNTLMRDAFDIIFALRYDNDPALLLEHFPNIVETIKYENDPMLQAIFNKQQEILNKLNDGTQVSAPAATTGKSISIGAIAAPRFDDDEEDTVVINQDTSVNPNDNFLSAAFGMRSD